MTLIRTSWSLAAGLLLLAAGTKPATAGGWTSGGGELLEDAINPWFIQSGPEEKIIRYCVEADEANFGVDLRQLSRQVRSAFDFWSEEFLSAFVPDNGQGSNLKVYVGRESFFEVPCTGAEQIRFQFGVLSNEQLTKFRDLGQDPTKMVGIAVRTEYDEARLTGKGFIYLSPARGPLAMTGRDVMPDPWSARGQSNLASVLLHEIGHMFGVHHSGNHRDLMGAGFPEYVVSPLNQGYHMNKGVFKVPQGIPLYNICYSSSGLPEYLRSFFGINPAHNCISAKIFGDKLRIFSRTEGEDPFTEAGDMTFEDDKIWKTESLIRVWLPSIQKVYQNVPDYLGKILVGPQVVHRRATGFYRNKDRTLERHLQVHISPNNIQVDGVVDGRIMSGMFISY